MNAGGAGGRWVSRWTGGGAIRRGSPSVRLLSSFGGFTLLAGLARAIFGRAPKHNQFVVTQALPPKRSLAVAPASPLNPSIPATACTTLPSLPTTSCSGLLPAAHTHRCQSD